MIEAAIDELAMLALWLLATLVLSLTTAGFYPVFQRVLRPCCSETRAFVLFAYGLAVPLVALVLAVLVMQPELAAWLVTQHCHDESCAPHRPTTQFGSLPDILLLAAATTTLVAVVGVTHQQLLRTQRRLRTLHGLSRPAKRHSYRVVDNGAYLAWCAGLWRPRVYLSNKLAETLPELQLQAVLAHEQAHVVRRDNLRGALLRFVTVFWPRSVRRRFLADWGAATEESCDQAAARTLGSPAPVIAALLALGHHGSTAAPFGLQSFNAALVDQRIAVLQQNRDDSLAAAFSWLLLAAFSVTAVLILADVLHHVIEWFGAPI